MKNRNKSSSFWVLLHMKTLIGRLLVLVAVVLLAGCIDKLKLSTYKIQYPVSNATYIGTVNQLPPIPGSGKPVLDDEFVIAYGSPPSGEVTIVLNGHQVQKYFVFGPQDARGDISKFAQFFRHGENILTVEPLAFGPSITFNLDVQGPSIVITKGKVNDDGTQVEIVGKLNDYSALSNTLRLDLVNINGVQGNGKIIRSLVRTESIPVNADGTFSKAVNVSGLFTKPLIYSFIADDVHGFSSKKEYLADDDGGAKPLPVTNAVRVAVGETFIQSMRPIIASSIYNTLKAAPIDVRNAAWNDTKICTRTYPGDSSATEKRGVLPGKQWTQAELDEQRILQNNPGLAAPNCNTNNDGSVFPPGLNPIEVNMLGLSLPTTVTKFFMNDGTVAKPSGAGTPKPGTILLNSFALKENNQLALNLTITEMMVSLSINAGIFGNLNMSLAINKVLVDTVADASAVNKKVLVQLDPDQSNIQLEGVYASQLTIFGINISGLANLILPALTGVLGDLLPGIINPILADNLQKIVIGGTFTQPETQTQFNMNLNVADMITDTLTGATYDLIVGLESVANVKVSDPLISPMLGPVYVDDPIDPSNVYNENSGTQGTNLTVAVSTNLLNQSLYAVYATGLTHFTFMNDTLYHGAYPLTQSNNSNTVPVSGDTRIRLWPDMPPAMNFSETVGKAGEGKAAIVYESATLALDTYRKNSSGVLAWQNDLELKVNFDLAVGITEDEGTFIMRAAGAPTFKISKMTTTQNIQIPKSLLQLVLDTAMSFGGNVLADRFIVLDLGRIAADTLNGTEVFFLSSTDKWQLDAGEYITLENGTEVGGPGAVAGTDGQYDLVKHIIEFDVATNSAGVSGSKGGNLFFQMMVRDPDLPKAPAVPRFDLDEDGITDSRDNCAMPLGDLGEIVKSLGGVAGKLDEDGNPTPAFNTQVKTEANKILAQRYGANKLATDLPSAADITHYNNMRTGDLPVNSSNYGSYPWLKVLYNNAAQINMDVDDRIGDLCENDTDRDGIWASYDNGMADNDNCPYIANPGQEDTQYPPGVGDACNVRTTFVLLRSLESAQGGTPQCLTRAGLTGTGWVSDTLKNMVTCNPNDTNQRWYMKALNPNDLNAGVEFYNNSSRNSNSDFRLTAYGEAKTWDYGNKETRVNEVRLLRTDNAGLKGQNDDSVSACVVWPCSRSQERADPVFFLRAAGSSNLYIENIHPWYIDTSFGTGRNGVTYPYPFANSDWTNLGKTSCMTYSAGFGVDLDSVGDTIEPGRPGYCGAGASWRWAIWVGATDSPWNGEW